MRPVRILAAFMASWRRWRWARLTEAQRQMRKAVNQMSPEDRAELKRELDEGFQESAASLRRSQRERRLQQREKSEAGNERLADYRADHAREMKRLVEEKRPKYVKAVREPFRNLLRLPLLFFTLRISRASEARMEYRYVDNPSVWRLWLGSFVVTLMRKKCRDQSGGEARKRAKN
jgi:hypothetical protein